jgi:bifunctional DNA-binding transcriptional regulator/antitoxin component of YhaV-PrlF toxin-antitoxin module
MSKDADKNIVLRDKRQLTLPRDICEQLGIGPGDKLTPYVEDGALVAKPNKTIALEALRELRESFKNSGITLKELLANGRRIRKELVKEYYGDRL